jgi:hypothetical protein
MGFGSSDEANVTTIRVGAGAEGEVGVVQKLLAALAANSAKNPTIAVPFDATRPLFTASL